MRRAVTKITAEILHTFQASRNIFRNFLGVADAIDGPPRPLNWVQISFLSYYECWLLIAAHN